MMIIVHSYYSFHSGVCSPESLLQTAFQRGYSAVALADINGLYGAVEFSQFAKQIGITPIIGATLQLDNHSTAYAFCKNEKGYSQLCGILSTFALSSEKKWKLLVTHDCSELIFISRRPSALLQLKEIIVPTQLYALPFSLSQMQACFEDSLWDLCSPASIPLAPLPDSWLTHENEIETFQYLQQLRERMKDSELPIEVCRNELVIPLVSTWQSEHPEFETVSSELIKECAFDFTSNRRILPVLKIDSNTSSSDLLREKCESKLPVYYPDKGKRDNALSRLTYELGMINQKGLADYFLYANEIISFARSKAIPIQIRGSAASSIVTYLLEFTYCCPLENDLCFERFINEGRSDLPDIDIDIADNRRDEVVRYCYDRWGEDHVAAVATIQRYKTRSAWREAARILGVSPNSPRLQSSIKLQNQCQQIARRLKGLPRHPGVHCGGLVITPTPITDYAPVFRASKGVVTLQYEKRQTESLGLIKMDLLGNTALSVIEQSTVFLKERGISFDPTVCRREFKIERLFETGDTLGIYQCESPGMRQLCRALRPRNQRETSHALSLIRPGPAAAGMKERYIRRCRGVETVNYQHRAMRLFLHTTYGIMLFQEDIMRVAMHVAGYSPSDADRLRKGVSNAKDSEWLENKRADFIYERAPQTGMSPRDAKALWKQITRFGGYAYCKAHATVYGRLAWLTARLKIHYPREFYASLLNLHKSMYPTRVFVWDAMRHGIPVFPPDIDHSALNWSPLPHGVQAGLSLIQGLCLSTCHAILNERYRQSFQDIADLLQRIDFQKGEIERLILSGALRNWDRREALLKSLIALGYHDRGQSLFEEEICDLPPLGECEYLLTGIPFARHPVRAPMPGYCAADRMQDHLGERVWMKGIMNTSKIVSVKKSNSNNNIEPSEMSFATFEDETGVFECVLLPNIHRSYGSELYSDSIKQVCGRVTESWNSLSLEVESVV